MGKYTADFHDHLVVPARVHLTRGQEHAFRLSGRAVPAPVPVRLLIDTGSKRSSLIPQVITPLDPALQGFVRVETSLAAMETSLYWARLAFPGTTLAAIRELTAARLPLPPSLHAYHGLLGRDLLGRWEYFLYEGRRGRFTLRDAPRRWFGWLTG
jgi:hypothetical protein